jgi:hypothetical protein
MITSALSRAGINLLKSGNTARKNQLNLYAIDCNVAAYRSPVHRCSVCCGTMRRQLRDYGGQKREVFRDNSFERTHPRFRKPV